MGMVTDVNGHYEERKLNDKAKSLVNVLVWYCGEWYLTHATKGNR